MGSCVPIRAKPNSKTQIKAQSPNLSIKDKLISTILSLHSLNLDCKVQIEDFALKKDLEIAVVLKQTQMQIQSYIKEIQDLLRKFDLEDESPFPDKIKEKYLNDQAKKYLKEFSADKQAEQVSEILKKNVKTMNTVRRLSDKMNMPKIDILSVSSEDPKGAEGNFRRKKFRKRRSSAV